MTENIGFSKILRYSPQGTNEDAHVRNIVDCESHVVKNKYLPEHLCEDQCMSLDNC